MASFRSIGQLTRRFSTTAVQNKLVATPTQVYGVEGRYAAALYSAAVKQKQLDAVEKDLSAFKNLLKTDAKFDQFLRDPSLQRVQKTAALETILKKQNYSSLTCNVFGAMAENGRLNKTDAFLATFGKIMSAHRGEVVCIVTTAKPLDARNQKDLDVALKGFLKAGQTIQVEMRVDPALLGGMTVSIGDKFVDMSIASKVKTYTKLINEAV